MHSFDSVGGVDGGAYIVRIFEIGRQGWGYCRKLPRQVDGGVRIFVCEPFGLISHRVGTGLRIVSQTAPWPLPKRSGGSSTWP